MKKILLLFVVLCGLSFGTVGAKEVTPTDELKPVLNDLTAVLSDEDLKGKEHLVARRDKIMSLIKRGFDFREMSKRVIGKKWRQIDDKEKDNFTSLMTKLLENVYIGKLESYSGQQIEFVAEKVKGQRAQVTTLIENRGAKIPVHYIMRKNDSNWLVYDINIEGVSLVRNYQEQFKSILRKEDYKGLVKVLEDKNRTFQEEAL
ncbi:MAG: ABC transporter substrate-binding protein [Desulfobulbaceae bacterium]|nr:ABC transporter substrate-binding protein [Desulfobulbaceae bacterium]